MRSFVVVQPLLVASAILLICRDPSFRLLQPHPIAGSFCRRRLLVVRSSSSVSESEESKSARSLLDHPRSAAAAVAATNDSEDEERHGSKQADDPGKGTRRRQLLLSATTSIFATRPTVCSAQQSTVDSSSKGTPQRKEQQQLPPNFSIVKDPQTYEAVVYVPPSSSRPSSMSTESTTPKRPLSLLVVLHGAGLNHQDAATAFLNAASGEHAYLAPYLISSGTAPAALADNFVVVAPHVGQGRRSFYAEPRSKLLQFISWIQQQPLVRDRIDDPNLSKKTVAVFLFGFSDGATVAVELATVTGRFAGAAVAAYGYSAERLPGRAVDLLRGVPFWVFHSADDVVFPVVYSDRLVAALRGVNDVDGDGKNSSSSSIIRYTRYNQDPAGHLTSASVRGHVGVGLAASQLPELYTWFLAQTQTQTHKQQRQPAGGE